MKFFSNETKENPDSHDDRGDVAISDPVAVPQQRAGSPWTDTPGSPDKELAEQEARDGTEEKWGYAQEAAPTTTTYGPDGTVTESAKEDVESKDDAVRDDDTFEAATGEPLDKTETPETTADEEAHVDEEARADEEAHVDEAVADKSADEEVEEEKAAEEAKADEVEAEVDKEPEAALADDGPSDGPADGPADGPEAVDPTTGESLDKTATEPSAVVAAEETATDRPAADEAVVVDSTDKDETAAEVDAAPVAAVASVPGSVPAPNLDRLFPGGDTYAERFREIQLIFVDSPKEATAQAAALVAEAVDAVTAALNEQKSALAADSDDTERLRVELRGYRDLLNRIVAL